MPLTPEETPRTPGTLVGHAPEEGVRCARSTIRGKTTTPADAAGSGGGGMPVGYFREWPGVTVWIGEDMADAVDALLGGVPPDGAIYRAQGYTADGWWTLDVWESEGTARRYSDEVLRPAAEEAGAPEPRVTALPVSRHSAEAMRGS